NNRIRLFFFVEALSSSCYLFLFHNLCRKDSQDLGNSSPSFPALIRGFSAQVGGKLQRN
ncbi:unnamed protein product, partial [Arabidopsis halleri]